MPADPAGTDAATTLALRVLERAPRTRQQLAAVLRRRGVTEATRNSVLDRLTEVGLLDDAGYAAGWVQTRLRDRGLARPALARELRAKGVAADVVAQAVGQVDDAAELAAARRVAARQAARLTGVDRDRAVRRLAGALARRGYPPGLVHRVVRETLSGPSPLADEQAAP